MLQKFYQESCSLMCKEGVRRLVTSDPTGKCRWDHVFWKLRCEMLRRESALVCESEIILRPMRCEML